MLTLSIRRFAIIVITLAVLGAGVALPARAGTRTTLPERSVESVGWQTAFVDFFSWLFGKVEAQEPGATTKSGSWWIPDGLD